MTLQLVRTPGRTFWKGQSNRAAIAPLGPGCWFPTRSTQPRAQAAQQHCRPGPEVPVGHPVPAQGAERCPQLRAPRGPTRAVVCGAGARLGPAGRSPRRPPRAERFRGRRGGGGDRGAGPTARRDPERRDKGRGRRGPGRRLRRGRRAGAEAGPAQAPGALPPAAARAAVHGRLGGGGGGRAAGEFQELAERAAAGVAERPHSGPRRSCRRAGAQPELPSASPARLGSTARRGRGAGRPGPGIRPPWPPR